MKHYRSLIVIGAVAILALGGAVYSALCLRSLATLNSSALTEAGVWQLVSDFRSVYKPLYRLELVNGWRNEVAPELLDPKNILPSPMRLSIENAAIDYLQKHTRCEPPDRMPTTAGDNLAKVRAWVEYTCGRTTALPDFVWREKPYIHPYGGSWAYWLYKQKFKDESWFVAQRNYVHVLERRFFNEKSLSMLDRTYNDMSPNDLALFLDGTKFLATEHLVAILAFYNPESDRVHVYDRKDWDQFTRSNYTSVTQQARLNSCDWVHDSYCWSRDRGQLDQDRSGYLQHLFLFLAALFLCLISVAIVRSRELAMLRKNQLLLTQTLAHELRHPVLSLHLIVESMRNHFDHLRDPVQTDFLRLAGTTERMKRLVEASQQYFRLLSRKGRFEFKTESLGSFREFFSRVTEDYENQITVQHAEEDCSCWIDAYWVALCIQNLTLNALMHGKPPVIVEWRREKRDLLIVVQDAGIGPKLPSPTPTQHRGMGLGLQIVGQIIREMGGRLDSFTQPTRFQIRLKGVIDEKSIARRG